MNSTQQAFLGSIELRLVALEQALANSQAREEETRRQLDVLIIRFKHLEGMISELKKSTNNYSDHHPHLLHYQWSSTEKGPEDRPSLIPSKPICIFVPTPSILTK